MELFILSHLFHGFLRVFVLNPLYFLMDIAVTIFYYINRDNYHDTKGKAVLITGCDTGFGRKAAEMFSERGAVVFAGCLTEAGVEELSQLKRVTAFRHDVTSAESTANAVETVKDVCLREKFELFGIITNAGVGDVVRPADWVPFAEYERILDINLMGTIRTVTAFLPQIKQSKGRIVIMTSILAHSPFLGASTYITSKFGARGFAESLRLDLLKKGVRVATVACCWYPTKVHDVMTDTLAAWKKLPTELQEEYPFDKEVERKEKIHNVRERNLAQNNIEEVVEAYYHGIFARWPLFTYYLGKQIHRMRMLVDMPDYFNARLLQHQELVLSLDNLF